MKSRLIPVLLTALIAAGLVSTPATAEPAAPTPKTIPLLTGWQSAAGTFQLAHSSRIVVEPPAAAVHDDALTFAADAKELTGRLLPGRPRCAAGLARRSGRALDPAAVGSRGGRLRADSREDRRHHREDRRGCVLRHPDRPAVAQRPRRSRPAASSTYRRTPSVGSVCARV